ncbi:hypothetical protein EKD04_015605 [Chloroflexales bacterium ZM16-3]|nr:hypothetical protein [Chloroflexales bacterium ZM16-3]
MTTQPSPLRVAARYTRSVHLQRDFGTRASLDGYQVTPLVIQTIERVMAGIEPNATNRAFSIIGPYGAGKSAFGVFLAHFLTSPESSRRKLVRDHAAQDLPQRPIYKGRTLLPILVSGNNSSLRIAVLRAVHGALSNSSKLSAIADTLLEDLTAAAADPEVDPQRVADLVERAADVASEDRSHSGALLLIDELGQFLDYAARHDQRDLFVLQTIAEMAARSRQSSFLFVTIMHQSFDRYIGTAGATKRTEWRKVQGRFIDLPFLEPDSQILRMVGRALCPADDRYAGERAAWAAKVAQQADALSIRPADIGADEWAQLVAQAYPLHPTVLVALPSLFRQIAQNERSLFAFLTAQEPWSLPEFLLSAPRTSAAALPIYRLPQLYSYVEATLGPSLFGRARGQRWAEIAALRQHLPDLSPLVVDVLTTIGVLSALGQQRGLKAGQEHIAFALREHTGDDDITAALSTLADKRLITYRKYRESYVLWEGSDLDLDGLIYAARRIIGDQTSLVRLLQQQVSPTPLIANRHSYQTGSLRHFTARFCDAADLPAHISPPSESDGEVLYIVPADDEALDAARLWAEDRARADQPWAVAVLPQRVELLRDLLLDVAALRHVLSSQPELEHDRAARLEITGRLDEASRALDQAIGEIYGPGESQWYWQANSSKVASEKQLDELLSRACDVAYNATPQIWNELIVRRLPSSAATKARRNLVEAMLDHAHEELLGLTGYPPERAIYESVLLKSGIHRQESDGVWRFGPPSNPDMGIDPAWEAIQAFIEGSAGAARPVGEIYAQLAAPPYGIKAGLLPLLFMAVYLANVGQIALYEHGNYVPVPDMAIFERFLRNQSNFSVRYSQVSGVRVAVFERVARAFAPKALQKGGQLAINDAIMPLLRFVVKLPAYSKATRRVSLQAQAIRRAMLEARAPDELLFDQLPHACDLPPFIAGAAEDDQHFNQFFAALRSGLDELEAAYQNLVVEVREEIRRAFGGLSPDSAALRADLTTRYLQIAGETSDTQLRALGVRLENAGPDDAWVESVAALVARKPLNTWQDADVKMFETQISDLGRRFKLVEQVAVVRQVLPPETLVLRVGVADAQNERSVVVQLNRHAIDTSFTRDRLLKSLEGNDILTREQQIFALADMLHTLLAEPADQGIAPIEQTHSSERDHQP